MEDVYNPEMIDLLNLHKENIMNSLNCHAIATIQSYSAVSKTCTATIVYKKTVIKKNLINNRYEDALQEYPLLIKCPVVNSSGGTAGVRFPVKKGDVALILFNDKDINNWFLGKQSNGATATKRTHHFSDGVALVGLFSQNDAEKNYNSLFVDKDKTVLFDGGLRVVLSNNKLKITNKPTDIDTLGMLLQELITNLNLAITSLTVAGVAPVVPGIAAVNVTALKLQGLLE